MSLDSPLNCSTTSHIITIHLVQQNACMAYPLSSAVTRVCRSLRGTLGFRRWIVCPPDLSLLRRTIAVGAPRYPRPCVTLASIRTFTTSQGPVTRDSQPVSDKEDLLGYPGAEDTDHPNGEARKGLDIPTGWIKKLEKVQEILSYTFRDPAIGIEALSSLYVDGKDDLKILGNTPLASAGRELVRCIMTLQGRELGESSGTLHLYPKSSAHSDQYPLTTRGRWLTILQGRRKVEWGCESTPIAWQISQTPLVYLTVSSRMNHASH